MLTEVYVISDLHLGGRPGFQMCPPESRRRAARFVRWLIKQGGDEREKKVDLELVINGDLVDFLAEEEFEAFTTNQDEAIEKLERIIETCDAGHPAEMQLFPALQEFLKAGHSLVILLGNHDIELALPKVKERFIEILTGGEPRRLQLLFDGEAHRRGELLIEHGNRYDRWNAVSYGALRALRSTLLRDEEPYPFPPPPGSILVKEIMNPLKECYRFIDLLKPENEVLIPIVVMLEPKVRDKLAGLLKALKELHKVPVKDDGDIPSGQSWVTDIERKAPAVSVSDEADKPQETFAQWIERVQDPQLVLDDLEGAKKTAGSLMEGIEDREFEGAISEEEGRVGDGPLAWVNSGYSILAAKVSKTWRYRKLLAALKAHTISISRTFNLTAPDGAYHAAAERLAARGAKVIIFGHTHLPRFISSGQSVYINTGTWCPTIELDDRLYFDDTPESEAIAELEKFVQALVDNAFKTYARLHTCYAHVVLKGDVVRSAKLVEFEKSENTPPIEGVWEK